MKTTKEKRDKERMKKLKLSIRVIGKTPEKKKKGATWEFELFKKIALDRSTDYNIHTRAVLAKHISTNWEECYKQIPLEDLTPTNFSHTTPKSRWEEYRLDPDNIEIVSRAWHHYEHTRQILKVDYPN